MNPEQPFQQNHELPAPPAVSPQPMPGYASQPAPAQTVISPTQPQQTMPVSQPPANPNEHPASANPYDFIFETKEHKKPTFFSGQSMTKKILVITAGIVLIVILGVIVFSLFTPKSNANSELFAIAQEQQEIVRIASKGSTKVKDIASLNFVLNTQLSISSDQSIGLKYITSHKGKVDEKLLASKADSTTDKLLADAQTSNTYDRTLVQTLSASLSAYQKAVNAAYQKTDGKNAKTILQNDFNNSQKLIDQSKRILGTN